MIKRLSITPIVLIVAAFGLVGLHLSMNAQPLPEAFVAATQSPTVRATVRATIPPTLTAIVRPSLSPSPNVTRTPTPNVSRTPSTVPSQTPLATLTPSQTLLPPPTFEPPTQTPPSSALPSLTPTFTPIGLGLVPGLVGAETSTPISTPGCVIRKDWKLTYTVQFNDALINIAKAYGTNVTDLVAGNCLSDANKIYLGEVLHVPGTVPPSNAVQCFPIQVLTPLNNTFAIQGSGTMEFHWYGPRTPRSLIRVFAPDGTKTEYVIDLRQDESIDLTTLPQSGTFSWYVYPLDQNFLQDCPEGGPWTFTKAPKPTATATSAVSAGGGTGTGTGH